MGASKKYISEEMNVVHSDEEPIYFDPYDPEALSNIIEVQHKITNYMKKQNKNKLFSILIIIDDFADSPEFSRHSKLLHALYTRGRHSMISTITATQKFSSLHPLIRVDATELYIYRLRNYKDLEAVLEELSALAAKSILLDMYNLATKEPHSFWYINLIAKKVSDMFFIKFNRKLLIE